MGDTGESATTATEQPSNFIRDLIAEHLRTGRYDRVVTRFPPEPNGYLHIGHAKSICLNFGLAQHFAGVCHLRMDDTNPTKEEAEYVESIANDVRWLGFDWKGQDATTPFYASDYFQQLYDWAELLIKKGLAYVDSQSREEIRRGRGTLTEPGVESPYRNRSVEENLDLFRRMRAGEFEEGAHVLRAKIDMSSPNMLMRDPILYRILKAHHHRTGDTWCIYPMYDYAHGLSDAIENITHSICTLEFENNRELYDWCLDAVGIAEPRPHQYEFARLALNYTVMSKRKLLTLVREGHVDGWDDPRMPTIAGFRRRGVRPEAIRAFAELIGVAKTNSVVDIGKLEYCIRSDLDRISPRYMGVLRPLEVELLNWDPERVDWFDAPLWPAGAEGPGPATRRLPLTRHIYIERTDFMENPPRDFHRLSPGAEVRLRYGYVIRCVGVERDETGEVLRLRCEVDASTRHGQAGSDTKKVKGTIHWVSKEHSVPAEVRLYDHLFTVPEPDREDEDFLAFLNPESKVVVTARLEPALGDWPAGKHLQLERQGYFYPDLEHDIAAGKRVFNKVVGLKDGWARVRGRSIAPLEATPSRHGLNATAIMEVKRGDLSDSDEGSSDAKRTSDAHPDASGRPRKLTRAEIRERRFAADPTLRARFERFKTEHGLSEDDAELCAETHALADFVEAALAVHPRPASVAKWVVNEVLREIKDRPLEALALTPAALGALAALVDEGVISATAAKQVFAVLVAEGGEPRAIVDRLGLAQVTDETALLTEIDAVIAANPAQVESYRGGRSQLLGFFVGQVMKRTGGRAKPDRVSALVKERLG